MKVNVLSLDYGELRKDLLESVVIKALSMPKIHLADLEKIRCFEHRPEPRKFHDLWRYIWGIKTECGVADLAYLAQTLFCDACLRLLRLEPSEFSAFIRENPLIQSAYSWQKNALTGKLALAEEDGNEAMAIRCRDLLKKIEENRSGKL